MIDNYTRYNLENRRYLGNKTKLMQWIAELIEKNTDGTSFFDVFAGTGAVSKFLLPNYQKIILNDFLYSNNAIYQGFFSNESYSEEKIKEYAAKFQAIKKTTLDDGYFAENYGDRFFSREDSKIIGEIREVLEWSTDLNEKEFSILLASLIYSVDKIANTVGHYDAYRKKVEIQNKFKFELINPLDTREKEIIIFQKDANELAKQVKADVAFIDPPYNSRQYSRFYHVLEQLVKWNKPELFGVAMKPKEENMSEYSRVAAPRAFDDLVKKLQVNYIVVTYNNTYTSKSSSSKNKITHDEIENSLNEVGKTKSFELPYKCFNAGKTELNDHREFVFITEVEKNAGGK